MFKCDTCNKTTADREPCNLTPVEYRKRDYALEGGDIRYGVEIVRIERKCTACFKTWVSAGDNKRILPELPKVEARVMKLEEKKTFRGRRGEDEDEERPRGRGGRKGRSEKVDRENACHRY